MLTFRALQASADERDLPSKRLTPQYLIETLRALLAKSLPPNVVDDRFGDSWASGVAAGRLVGALAFDGEDKTADEDEPAGEVVGAAVGLFSPEADSSGIRVALDCLVAPGRDRPSTLSPLLERAVKDAELAGATRIETWLKPTEDSDEEVFDALGAVPYRTLHQMRRSLPLPVGLGGPALATRAFVPGVDEEALVHVNNRAFFDHPVQGTLTVQALVAEMAEPWFTADGVRMHEIDGVLAGFCWTKQHPGALDESLLGEIYVICVDPAFHGRSLGRPMTSAGLDWLAEHGSRIGMLYVEADNAPAVRTYEGLGFEIVRTDRAWLIPVG